MAQLLNYRNALLQAATQRVIGSAVVVTSGAATSLNVPKGSNTTIPGTITLTASVTKFVSPAYAWYYKKYEDAAFTSIAGQTLHTLDVVGDSAFLTANLTTSAVQYKVIVTETGAAYPSTAEYTVTIPILRDGTDSTLGFLTNDSVAVPANEVGVVPADAYSALTSTLVIYRGTVDDSANWSAAISAYTPGITAALVNGKTISITNITSEFNSGYVEIEATRQNYANIVKRLSIAKVATGISPTIYSIEPNVYAIAKNPDGTYNPAAVTFSSYSVTGNTKTAYLGLINIYHNDSATPAYVSQAPEAVKTYTIPIGISTLRVELLSNGSPSAVLDSQTIPIAEAGSSSVDIIVTNSTFVIPANANNDVLSYINSGTNITVREGTNPLVYRNSLLGQVSSFTVGTATLSTGSGITVGSVSAGSDGSTVATILQHSNMLQAIDSIIITYPVTYVRANGSQATEYVTQSITKAVPGYRGSRNVYGSDPSYTATYDYDGVGVTAPGAESYAKKADDLIYAATLNSSPRTPIEGDTVTFSNNSNYVYTITYKANTSAWEPPGTVIDGSLLVTGSITADKLDTRELTIRDASGNIVVQAGAPIDWTKLGTPSANLTGLGYTGALDATRNVFRGAWSTSTAYVAGDSITYNGSTWAAVLAHTSVNGTNNPPTLPTISNTWWTLVAAKGDSGVNGTRTAILEMYQWAASAPTTFPSGSSTYTWATGQFTAPATVNGWSLTPPAPVAGQTLWVCRTIFADSLTSATSAIAWSAATAVAAGGSGASGVNGTRTAVLELYRWSASTPTTFPSGSSTYTWTTGAFTPPATLNSWGLTPGAAVAGQTLWGCSVTYADTETSATSAVTWSASTAYAVGAAGSNGVDGSAGANAISAILSNEAHVFPAASDGTVATYAGSGTEVRVFEGATALTYDGVGTSNGTWTVSSAVTNIVRGTLTDSGTFLTVGAHSGVAAGTDTSVIVYTITGKTAVGTPFTITKNQTFSKSKAGAAGATGAAGSNATAYWLVTSAPAVQKSVGGVYTPSVVTYSSMSATGTAAPAAYAGRFIIATSTDGTTYTDQYTSAANESSKAFTIPANIKTVRVRAYLAGGTTTLLDELITAVVSDGATGATGATGRYGLNFAEAKSMFTDPTFQVGSNSVGLYNNAGGGTVTHTREARQTDSPFTDSGFNMKISNTGAASPGIGGFIHSFNGRASAVFVQRIVAKIPVGYTIEQATNAIGDGATNEWITPQAGTGKFEEYILVRRCGATGTFSGSGHIYLNGAAGSAGAPVNWYVAYAATYDFTAVGFGAVTAVLSNETHTIPTDSAGNNGNFTGSATTVTIYNGTTDDSANWTVAATPIAGVTGSLVGKTYTVTAMTVDTGYVDLVASRSGYASVTKRFTLAKSKAGATGASGATGAAGAQGPSVVVTPDRVTTFTATDGTLDASQANIVFTAAVSGVASPTYVWSFSGFQTAPTNSGTSTQTITAAQFGTAKSAIVTCTVSGTYTDKVTIVRLEKSTAAAGATVGATWGTNISGQPANSIIYNSSVTLAADGTLNGAGGGQVTLPGMGLSSYRVVAAGYTATNKPTGAGLYDAKTGGLLVGLASMYRVVKIHRTTGVLTNVGGWNVLAGGTNSADMAAALNAIGNDHIVVVFTNDEPAGNRLTGGLPAAMYRCGASRGVFGSSSFQGRSAYALIGIAGCGEGNGAEFYQGEIYGDANAWIDASFSIIGGNLVGVSGSYTPRTLTDYGYTGALDANNTYVDANGAIQGVSSGSGTAVNNAFLDTLTFTTTNVTVSGNTFKKTGGVQGQWDAQAYTKESYTLGAYASFSPDQSTGNSMAGLNTDPATDASYSSIDYAVYFANGTVTIYESNVSRGNFGTYVAGDIFGVTYDGVNVRYYKNGGLLRTVAATISAPLYFDSSIYTLNNSISKVKFGPMSSSSWSSIGGTGKPADNATVGAPTGTYVGGVLAETVAGKADGALQKAGDAIIGPVTFATNGGILAATDADNGVFMGPNGLVGKKAGVNTFVLDAQGQLGIASATSGARMEIKNNVIKVFDASGVLRVQIGDLTV